MNPGLILIIIIAVLSLVVALLIANSRITQLGKQQKVDRLNDCYEIESIKTTRTDESILRQYCIDQTDKELSSDLRIREAKKIYGYIAYTQDESLIPDQKEEQ